MKVLVTGAKGFLGSATVRALIAAGYQVIASARSNDEHHVGCDLTDLRAITTLLEDQKPDAIVNCAACVDFSVGILDKLYPINTLVPAIIASWCVANRAYLVQVSGTAVQGVRTCHIDAKTPIDPDTDYGRSKWLAETMVRASGAQSSIVRFCGIFGASGPDHLGLNKSIRDARRGVVPKVFGKGLAKRNYIHVSDAADMLSACVEKQLNGVYLAGGRERLSISAMFQAVCELYNLDGPVFVDGQDARDQIVDVSASLPPGKSFAEALASEL